MLAHTDHYYVTYFRPAIVYNLGLISHVVKALRVYKISNKVNLTSYLFGGYRGSLNSAVFPCPSIPAISEDLFTLGSKRKKQIKMRAGGGGVKLGVNENTFIR
jgi:hypothetical protein